MVMRPNWFDNEFESRMEKESIENLLLDVARNPRVIQAVKQSLAARDTAAKQKGWGGPSRSQAVREAFAAVLQAQD